MPPRKASARRNKASSKKASTPVADHELPAPEVKIETELGNDLKVNETAPDMSIPEQISDSNRAEIEEVILTNRSVGDVNEAMDEGGETVFGDGVVKKDLHKSGNVKEEKQGEELAKDEEITSAQEEMTAVQADDTEILDDNNNDQDSDISKGLCKNNDVVFANNGDIKGITEVVSIQESAQDVSTRTSCENDTALDVKDDSMLNLDDYGSDDYSEGDDADGEGDGDQEPSLIVQDSSPSNKKDKGTEIYVGKLDKDAVEDDLVSVFQHFGELKSTRIVRKPNSNKSKGFGFVRFASVDQAKRALSELKDGVEVRGKPVVLSASQDNDTLYLGNICKTWKKEQVLQQLKEYEIEHIEVLRLPEDPKIERKNKGFAFLEFSSHADAVTAFQRLKKPDVVFGRDVSAKVAFAQSTMHSTDEDLSQVKEVHLEGLTKDWNEEKVKDICKEYGEILQVNLCPGKRNKRRDFGFVTFSCSESALACVKGINDTAIEGEVKIRASIAKSQQKGRVQTQGLRGGFKVDRQSETSNKKSQSNRSKMKGFLNTQQTKINKKHPSQNKLQKDEESSKVAELSKMKGDNNPQQHNRKRKAFSEQKLSARGLGTSKKPKNAGEGQNSRSVSKAGSHKRKNPSGNETREDRGNRSTQGKKFFKKQKVIMLGRETDSFRKPGSDNHFRRGHDDYISTRYVPKYAASASNAYYVASDHSLSTMRYKEMEPHAGYIEPAYAKRSGSYTGNVQPVVRTPPTQHQTVYYEPSSTSHSRSHVYPRYLDRPVMTQSHRGYIETAVAPEVQPYRDYRPPANVQIARDHYDPGHARIVRHDDRGAGLTTYVGGEEDPGPRWSVIVIGTSFSLYRCDLPCKIAI
ncbi:hypothetical protein E3N88_38783 [Mikania micrantha]|uniref:RRM domain-containing protein n=1 Tax=Mikania micrantha TaxID=192012 RepID=A0A5N6LUY6_9ASTR|nr:hypothetical protein E3N88_38783 [Mikania micrantha]